MVDVNLKVPKELNDVRVFIVGLTRAILVDKDKEVAQKLMEQLPPLMDAIQGYDELEAEMAMPESNNAIGLLVADLVKLVRKQ